MRHTLIFDYDGTIHDTLRIYEPAFRQAYEWLVRHGYTRRQEITSETIAGWLGLNSREMWNSFLPELSQALKERASAMVGKGMTERIASHQAAWYPGADKMLDVLKETGHTMVILSNCKIAYREANWKEFNMQRWFAGFYDCESYGFVPKTEIITHIQKEFPGPYIIIGDRQGDLECARASGSWFIGCRYGFGQCGELDEADYIADSVEEIAKLAIHIDKYNI